MLITIQWYSTKEYMRIDENALPKVGEEFTTTEDWPDDQLSVAYRVLCQESKGSFMDKLQLKLLYARDLNPNHPNCAWGTTTLEIERSHSPQKYKATAKFECPDLPEYSGTALACKVFDDSLLDEDLCLESVLRLTRPKQWAMREELLRLDKACVISDETTKEVLDAAHIVGHTDNGIADTRNGLLLRADLHRLFDRGILQICEDGTLSICDDVCVGDEYRRLIERKQRLSPYVFNRVREALAKRKRDTVKFTSPTQEIDL